jgi:NTP pyrophosphatase (non-canonical NTP hydrolase)
MSLDSSDHGMFKKAIGDIAEQLEKQNRLMVEQNRKLEDLIAAVLTLANIRQRDLLDWFENMRQGIDGRK